jgi:hypothetical protein
MARYASMRSRVASMSILTSCSSQPTYHQTVTDILITVGCLPTFPNDQRTVMMDRCLQQRGSPL